MFEADTMIEIMGATELGLKEEKLEDLELDLVLSIGGSYGKSEKAREPVKGLAFESSLGSNGEDSGGARKDRTVSAELTGSDLETGGSGSDPNRKRAMQAMRRFEAKKKREEKRRRNNAGRSDPVGEPAPKKVEEEGVDVEPGAEGAAATAHPVCPPYLVVPVQFPYGPFVNGYGFPYWVPGPGKSDGVWELGQIASDQSSSGKKTASSNGSQVCSSSGVSDCQRCSPRQGGTGCDAKNCSTASSRKRRLPKRNSPRHPSESAEVTDEAMNLSDEKADSTSPTRSADPTKPKEDAGSETQGVPQNPDGECVDPRSASPNGGSGKPPRPSHPLLQMPRVSTTGSGPNGKTVNGFLHRYTKAEVSIVCTCHGFSFSPAEFVEHAGGTDVSHPLRHITMVP
ncbi:ninja-family protein 3 [Rhodamnia argentea]|uniref:Ninja-family protein n=1 Tax=Rhodamnia argentea TaxID=178133 RepID=A0A8B8N795_9MYRT|nr:ninja-family protein 3 [Rhodamnia argentea]